MTWEPTDFKAEFLSTWSTVQAWRYAIADARRYANENWGKNQPIRVYLGVPGEFAGLAIVSYDETYPVPYRIPTGVEPVGEVENCDLALIFIDPESVMAAPLALVQYGRAWEEWVGPMARCTHAMFVRATADDAVAFLDATGTLDHTYAARCDPEWTIQGILDYVAESDLSTLPYSDYLKTDHWREIREVALNNAGHRCQLCNTDQKTLHVHHRTYERRGFEWLSDLIVLCASCHATFHKKLPKGEE